MKIIIRNAIQATALVLILAPFGGALNVDGTTPSLGITIFFACNVWKEWGTP